MTETPLRCLLISDFTIDNLAGLLTNDDQAPFMTASVAPFDQVVPTLLDGNLPCWQEKPDCAVVWTRPEGVIESFGRLLRFEHVEKEKILSEVDEYVANLVKMSERVRFALVPTWVVPTYVRGRGLLDMDGHAGIAGQLMRINLRLTERLSEISNIYVIDAQRWITSAGKHACNPKLWYMGKIGFSNEVFGSAVADIKAAARAVAGATRKLIIVDLDDTLWGGIIGEDGMEGLRLGGHDAVGEAYADFQRALQSMTRRGLILAVVSKNDEQVALEAIRNHPEMVVSVDDLAGWRINWQDKAQNVAELVDELRLGLQSVVFIDNSPVERDRVRSALPEVLVPEWPADPMLYKAALLSLDCFDSATLTSEDSLRTHMYAAERDRQELKRSVSSVDDWLAGLQTKVQVEEFKASNRERTVQLLNKTNQMNLATRRLTEGELASWLASSSRKLWTFRVSDKFGDAGLTGIVSCEQTGDQVRVVDFLLSCRVLGRKVEETVLHVVIDHARSVGAEQVLVTYVPTAKNAPCREFLRRSGLTSDEANETYRWSTDREYPLPSCITLERQERPAADSESLSK